MYVKFPLLSSRTVSAPFNENIVVRGKRERLLNSLLSVAQFQISHLRDTAPSLCSTRLSFRFLGQVMRYSPRKWRTAARGKASMSTAAPAAVVPAVVINLHSQPIRY